MHRSMVHIRGDIASSISCSDQSFHQSTKDSIMYYLVLTFVDGSKYEYQCENEDAAKRIIALLPETVNWALCD